MRFVKSIGLLVCLLISVLLKADTPAYTIKTFAGSDLEGDGGPARLGFVSILEGVCSDADGNIYVADADDNRIRKIDNSGIVTTYAGNGYPGFSGDGGPATQAAINSPFGIRMDASGNLFIADLGNGRIRKVNPAGVISTIAGGLNSPRNLTFAPDGTLYVSEFDANRVSRINSDGSATPIAGNGTSGSSGDGGSALSAQLNGPAGIGFDTTGVLYIADSSNARIRKVTPDGNIVTFLGGPDPVTGINFALRLPTGLFVDQANNLYVANTGYPETFRFDSSGHYTFLAGVGRDIAVAPNGDVLLVGQQHLEEVHSNGSVTTLFSSATVTFGDGGPATKARFETLAGIAADNQGNVVVSDSSFHRLRQIGLDGTIESLQASDYMTSPRTLAFDPQNRLFVADGGTIKIANPTGSATNIVTGLTAPAGLAFPQGNLEFTDNGALFAAASSGPPTAVSLAQTLNSPTALAADSSGNFYVADTGNHVIRKIGADGSDVTIAGNGSAGFGGDDGPATQSQLNAPSGLAVDGHGTVWIADSGNNRVRFIDTSGNIHTAAGTGSPGFSGDGGAATQANLSNPTAIACDSQGNVFFVDSGNRRVRALTVGVGDLQSVPATITITHAATFLTGTIAGGEIVSIFGPNIGPAIPLGAALDSTGHVSTNLGGTQVLVGGVSAPLYYVGLNQINAQIPVESSGHLSALIEVQRNGVTLASVISDISPYTPGLFALANSAAALNYPDYSLNGPTHPAAAGSVVILYGTGFGDTSPLDVTGLPAVAPLGVPLAVVSVFIGGNKAELLYVGDAPGFAGLTQINAVVPPDTPAGLAQVQVSVANVVSPPGIYLQIR